VKIYLYFAFALAFDEMRCSAHCCISGILFRAIQLAFEIWVVDIFFFQRVESCFGIYNVPARWYFIDRQLVSRLVDAKVQCRAGQCRLLV